MILATNLSPVALDETKETQQLQLYTLLRALKVAQLPLQALSQKTQMSLDFWTDNLRHDYFCITSDT
jgi:hypothetical protein